MTTATTPRIDIYTRITNQIVEELERGVRPWLQPWRNGNTGGQICRPRRHNGEPYKGINVLQLWAKTQKCGYLSPYWITFKQALEWGGYVRKGERGTAVVYCSSMTKTETNKKGEEVEREIFFMKEYTVFCADQCNGLPEHFYVRVKPAKPSDRIAKADAFFANTKASIRIGGGDAFYTPYADYIQMPPVAAFSEPESYAATLLALNSRRSIR
ncbi:ssDNA-binding domain-containing protein [bacterium]|nr:ssDNA-binding domain-containing protein [bacterium]